MIDLLLQDSSGELAGNAGFMGWRVWVGRSLRSAWTQLKQIIRIDRGFYSEVC